MKYVCFCLIAFTGVAYGACTPDNFEVELGQFTTSGSTYQIPFTLKNNNDEACGAEIVVRLNGADGALLGAQSGWLASTGNIPSQGSIEENWGSKFEGVSGGSGVTATVLSAKSCEVSNPPVPCS